jgi:YbbR domain-containing protein
MKPKILTIALSTIFSIILWVYVSFSYEYTTSIRVPVKFNDIKEGNALLYTSSKFVNISLKGQGWVLAQISFGPETVFNISTNEQVGVQNVDTRIALSENDWISSSLGVSLITPADINYKIERLNYKDVPLELDVQLSIKKGYGLVENIVLSSDSVRISGPQSLIKSIESVRTENYLFENVDETINYPLLIKPIEYISFDKKFVSVDYVVQKIVDKTFNNVPVTTINVPSRRELELFPNNIDITLKGGLNNLGLMTSDSLKATIDFNDAFLDTLGIVTPKITVPKFTTLKAVKPATLKYIIKQN